MHRSHHRPRLPRPVPTSALLLALLLASACIDSVDDLGPGPGTETVLLDAVLESPHGPEGAVLLDVSAEEVVSIQAVDSETEVVGRPAAGGRSQVALVRQFPGEIGFRMTVVESVETPDVRILQVADWENRLREGVDGYELRILR